MTNSPLTIDQSVSAHHEKLSLRDEYGNQIRFVAGLRDSEMMRREFISMLLEGVQACVIGKKTNS